MKPKSQFKFTWKRSGHRSVKHLASPKCVVRFGRSLPGRLKLLENREAWEARTRSYGLDPIAIIDRLLIEATDFWEMIQKRERKAALEQLSIDEHRADLPKIAAAEAEGEAA